MRIINLIITLLMVKKNGEVDLSLNNGGTEDDEIVIIKENTYIRSA